MRLFAMAFGLILASFGMSLQSLSASLTIVESVNGVKPAELMSLVRLSNSSDEIYRLLDKHQPRFWNELHGSEQLDVADIINRQLNHEGNADETSVSGLTAYRDMDNFENTYSHSLRQYWSGK